jgi:hypothetical protein
MRRRPLSMLACGALHGSTIDAAVRIRKTRETRQSGVEKPHSAAKRSTLQVVIRSSNLNQTLEKLIELGFRRQPELFPGFRWTARSRSLAS